MDCENGWNNRLYVEGSVEVGAYRYGGKGGAKSITCFWPYFVISIEVEIFHRQLNT